MVSGKRSEPQTQRRAPSVSASPTSSLLFLPVPLHFGVFRSTPNRELGKKSSRLETQWRDTTPRSVKIIPPKR